MLLYYRPTPAAATPAAPATASIIPTALSDSDIDPAGTDTDAHLRERGGKGAEHKGDRSQAQSYLSSHLECS
jgi:hypothetical protein